ncbi:hypothetical protein XANCAGTX0491_000986 [Xanthoria calcicola]
MSAPVPILNYFITLALVLSYFPQYQRIISCGSTHGIFYPRPALPDKPPKRHSLSKSDLALSPERRELEASIPYPRLPRIIGSISVLAILLILVPPLAILLSPAITPKAYESLIQD